MSICCFVHSECPLPAFGGLAVLQLSRVVLVKAALGDVWPERRKFGHREGTRVTSGRSVGPRAHLPKGEA